MSTQAPVCHLPSNTVASDPGVKSLPNVPPAQPNIASLTATVNALRQLVMILSGQGGGGSRQGGSISSPKQPSGSWTQKDLQTETVRIYQNNDPSTGVYVEFERVSKLVMKNNATPQLWTYNAPPNEGG